ncbi:MAG: ABC transporter ATP-binding protein [Alphaproteobacteria bacterium]|nr:ABC transporter ATP-binding protein [Alphaproteobacteria bacterium]
MSSAGTPPLLALSNALLSFGGRPLFVGLDFALAVGERACLVGRNGAGKTTILKLLAGAYELDAGERFLQPGTRIGYLPQQIEAGDESIADYVAGGVPDGEHYRALAEIDRQGLDPEARMRSLSGGELRRAGLARAFAAQPQILLLDEPTNHLDLPAIEGLETRLLGWRGALLLVSHDRAFLRRVSNRCFWLVDGKLRRLEAGYESFDSYAAEVAEAEAKRAEQLETRLKIETHWFQRSITAQRTRDEGRAARLQALRAERRELIAGAARRMEVAATEATSGGKLVIEATHITKLFGERVVIGDFSTRIQRGDHVGIMGPNGAGKTTLVKLLIGVLAPDGGKVRHGARLALGVFDQERASLEPEKSLWDTLTPSGGDSVMVGGKQIHVVAYLRQFLFSDAQATAKVSTLSGGERNRLLLARVLAQPSNVLVLDEPTNDLDMDTLDVLIEALDAYAGTLILVSHDRDFLDRLVTSVIVVEGDGRTTEYAGGYSDMLRQRGTGLPPRVVAKSARELATARIAAAPAPRAANKLSFREQTELSELPAKLERLAAARAALERALADPALARRDAKGFADTAAKHAEVLRAIAAAEERWLTLAARAEGVT